MEEFHLETASLLETSQELELELVESVKIQIYFKRFRTGKIYRLKVSNDMVAEELKNRLINTAMPEYFKVKELREQIAFVLMKLNNKEALIDNISLNDNGVKENDTLYLEKVLRFGRMR